MATTTNADLKIRISVDKGNTLGSINGITSGFLKATAIIKGVELGLRGLEAGFRTLSSFIQGSITTAKDFQSAMLNVKALTGTVGDEFDTLSDLALELGSNTEFTAVQVGDAMGFMAMAGLETNEILAATPSILNLASAASLDFATSADIATNIMAQFSIEAEDVDRVVDVLAKTVTSSNTDMMQLADAMNFLGPTAAAMGISLEETAAIIGLMANNGLKGSLGTRALGTSLTRLTKPTAAMKGVMNDLNLEFFDINGNMNSVDTIVDKLNTSFDGLTQEQRQNALATLFGAEAIQEWNILVKEGGDSLRDFTGTLIDSGGAAEVMAQIKLSGLEGAMLKVTSAWEGFQIKLVDSVGGMQITQDAATFIAQAISNLEGNVFSAVESFKVWLVEMQERFGPEIAIINAKINDLIIKIQAIWERHGPAAKEALKAIAEQGLEVVFNTIVTLLRELDQFAKWLEENPEKVQSVIKGFEVFGNVVLELVNDVNLLIRGLSTVIETAGKINDISLGAATGGTGGFKLPFFASGTDNFPGVGIVGENGPELFVGPQGSSVINNQNSQGIIEAIKGLAQGRSTTNNFGSVSFGGNRGSGQEMNMFSSLLMNAAA